MGSVLARIGAPDRLSAGMVSPEFGEGRACAKQKQWLSG